MRAVVLMCSCCTAYALYTLTDAGPRTQASGGVRAAQRIGNYDSEMTHGIQWVSDRDRFPKKEIRFGGCFSIRRVLRKSRLMKVTKIKFKNTPTKPYCYMYRNDQLPVLWDKARVSRWEFLMKCLDKK